MSKAKVKAPVKAVRPAAKINHDLYSILFWITRCASYEWSGTAKTTMYFISDELMADAKRLVKEISAAQEARYAAKKPSKK